MWKITKAKNGYRLKLKDILSWSQVNEIEAVMTDSKAHRPTSPRLACPENLKELLSEYDSKTFQVKKGWGKEGYDLDEVDDFLDRFRDELLYFLKYEKPELFTPDELSVIGFEQEHDPSNEKESEVEK
jgi:DivIVA domain-containing protein